ncbi:MAG: hypothetical protein LBQ84_08655 [Flavobacteriaceae bacterium]|nr:hypothetical protein [Flavobacteriaceae bacterium]
MKSYLNFETLSEIEAQKLAGGFSSAFSFFDGSESGEANPDCKAANNCLGGNCLSGCNNKSPNNPAPKKERGTPEYVTNNCVAGGNCSSACRKREK